MKVWRIDRARRLRRRHATDRRHRTSIGINAKTAKPLTEYIYIQHAEPARKIEGTRTDIGDIGAGCRVAVAAYRRIGNK